MHKFFFWARLASFGQLGLISNPQISSKSQILNDPKGLENNIYTMMKGRETIYDDHPVPITSCSEVKFSFKRLSFGSKDYITEQKTVESTSFLGQNS